MAKNDGITLERLYIELGLDLSQLQSDILAADRTVTENISRLNREKNIIKLRMEADLAGLDAVADKTKILEVQERSLTQLLDLQRDKLKLATAAYQDVAQSKGANSAAAKQLETSMERERIAVARLESQLKSLSAQKISLDTSHLQENISKLNAQIQHVKIRAEIDTSKLQGTNAAFDAQKVHIAAVTKELELQRQKLIQLREAMYKSAQSSGAGSVQTLNIKSNVLQQIREINQLEIKLKELKSTNINLQIRADSIRQAEQTIQENIARINARIDHIKVKTDIDVSKLGSAVSEFDKAKAHVQGLNRELELQNQKLTEMRKAFATAVTANGLNNVKTINLSTEIQKQIQEINQLEAKIKELNSVTPPKSNGLLGGYLNIKGNVSGTLNELANAYSQLQGATSSADSAIVASLGVIGTIPSPVGRAVAAFASLPVVLKGVENSLVDMTRAAAASGDAVYVMSRGFQMSVADTGKFTTNAKVAGVEVLDLASTVKRVQQQIVKGGGDSRAAEWLKRYGESAYDASGRLKNLNEMTFALSRALHKAQDDGKGMEFVLSVFRNISADAITAIEDIEAVNEQAKTIVKAGLANPALAHEVQGNLNALNVQSGQLNASFTNALLPVANEIIPRVTERMGKLTKIISDNKDVILAFGRDFAQVWGAVEDTVDKVGEGLGVLAKLARDNRVVRQTSQKDIVDKYKDDASIKNAEDLLEREIAAGGYTDEDIKKLRTRNDLYLKEVKQSEQDMKTLWAKRREEFAKQNETILRRYAADDSIKTATDLLNKLTDAEKEAIGKTSSVFGSLQERIAALHPEFEKLQVEAKEAKKAIAELLKKPLSGADSSAIGQERRALGENDELIDQLRIARKYEENAAAIRNKLSLNYYDFNKRELQRWLQEQLPRDAEQSLEKYKAVMEEYKARSAQIEQERADKVKEIRDSVEAADKTTLQNKLDNIDKERQAWIKAGMDEAEATELAQKKIAKAYEEANEKIQEHLRNAADIEYELTHTAFEKQLRDIERWEELQKRKAESTEEAAAIGAEAVAKEAQAFEREMDRIKGTVQSLEDKIFEIDHSQYENDLRRIQQEYIRAEKEFQDLGIFTPERKAQLDYLYNRQKQILDAKAAKGGDYTKPPEGATSRGGNGIVVIGADQIIDDGKINQSIGLFVDDSREFSQQLQKLSDGGRDLVLANRQLADAQKNLIQSTNQTASGFQIIAGDQVVNQPTAPQQPTGGFEIIAGDQVISSLQQFGDTLNQTSNAIEQADPVQALKDSAQMAADAQKSLADNFNAFPPEYFKQLADGTKAVSDMQLALTKSTMNLIDAQDKLAAAFENLPTANQQRDNNQQDGLMKLNYSAQDSRLAQISDIPPQTPIAQKNSGFKFGFDMDAAGLISGLASLGLMGATAPVSAPVLGTVAVGSILAGLAKGSYDATTAEQPADRLQPLSDLDLSAIVTPLGTINDNLQSLLQAVDTPLSSIIQQMQDAQPYADDRLQELLGALPNIDANVLSVLQELQARETTLSFETVITPLNNIAGFVQNILTALGDRQPPQITVSPNNNINLGGAYVFDNAMKKSLVDDITARIVREITTAVQQATGRSSYGFSA